jgi:FtsH-binding integral membrane protein
MRSSHARDAASEQRTRQPAPEAEHRSMLTPYLRFAAMVATSTVVMFGLMYLNTYQLDHVFFSETRAYMAAVMGATMAVIMLAFMRRMYTSRAINGAIVVASVAIFGLALWLVRSQVTIEDVSYMRAMIPHHSIAIMTSERARIHDPRVRALADQIIESQRREIGQMKTLITDLDQR